MDKVSIIVTHWGMNDERSQMMRTSLLSLFETAPSAEIIVVDNGEDYNDSLWLMNQAHRGSVACYIRNRHNMHFGYARNQGLKMATGDFIVISDNDILFREGWMEGCVEFLKNAQGSKVLATPLSPDPMNQIEVRWVGELNGWRLNTRAGSNLFMMERSAYNEIGDFELHRIAGSHYCDRYRSLGYAMAVMPQSRAIDMGLRKGYNFKEHIKNTSL